MTSSQPATLEQAVAEATRRLAGAGIEAPRRDARLLVCSLLGGGPELLLARPERRLSDSEAATVEAAVARRLRREPISRILGRREFWSLEFLLDAETLDPRPDSETLVEAVLQWAAQDDKALRLLDLGSGSGCLLLALISELPRASGLGIDIAAGAVAVATENARRLGLSGRAAFIPGSWQDALPRPEGGEPWDIVISNPPYVPTGDIETLEAEVSAYDPVRALDGGADGLDAYRALIPKAAAVLRATGLLALEVGEGQAGAVKGLLQKAGFSTVWTARDLSGIERCVLATQARKSRESASD